MEEISVVCGLGNPGARYRFTRHNIGFHVLDEISRRNSLTWRRARGPSQLATWSFEGRNVILLKPLTYMNNSGIALSRMSDLHHSRLLVVCDDIHLALGRIRFRKKGSSGGHNGLQSIIDELGTDSFARLRLGIGPPPQTDWAEFVLDEFTVSELPVVDSIVKRAAEAIETVLRLGLSVAMDRYNR